MTTCTKCKKSIEYRQMYYTTEYYTTTKGEPVSFWADNSMVLAEVCDAGGLHEPEGAAESQS